ncbi:hypothetical protein [Phormidium nigroviride]
MVENQFSIGDLVAHKHYPEKAIGTISKFHNSGRVGVSGDNGTRSFLPHNLIALEITASPTPPPTSPIPPEQAQTEELTEHSENCSQCGSQDLRRFHYHDPNEYYFYCRDCGHEGWRHEKLPPAQVEKSEVMEVEELEDAIATPAEGITKPTEAIDTSEDEIGPRCPQCGSYKVSQEGGWNEQCDYFTVRCEDCGWEESYLEENEDSNPTSPTSPNPPVQVEELEDTIAAQADLELPPIPRDFSELEQLPEWWERPILPDFRECSCGEPYDDDDDLDWVQETYGVNATYRGWKLTIYEGGYQIYATPPSSDRLYHCECELDLDGPDGQIALAQEFIDSWYFAQPSPGQLSLNIRENVARAPPPRFG